MAIDDAEKNLDRAAAHLREAATLAVLTGAGISAESGVPTFRDSNGLWEGHAIEDVATPEGFRRNPRLVWQFYNARRATLAAVQPNAGHHAIVALERRFGAGFTLVTQNVDGLHRRAGSSRVFEIHGDLRRTRCTGCHAVVDRGYDPLGDMPACPDCQALLRPNVVWFHEPLPVDEWKEAALAAHECDVMLVVGTSAVVHPAAGLIDIARNDGATVIEVNVRASAASDRADLWLVGAAGEVLPRLVAALNTH